MKEIFYILCSFVLVGIAFTIPNGESIFALVASGLVRSFMFFLAGLIIGVNFELRN